MGTPTSGETGPPPEPWDPPPTASTSPGGRCEVFGGAVEVGIVALEVVVTPPGPSPPPSGCCGVTPVQASAPGAPRPGVGSKGTQPAWLIHTSGQAWALRPRTM